MSTNNNIHLVEKKPQSKRMIYISSPFSDNVRFNIQQARKYSRFAVDNGCMPITSHLLYPQFMKKNERELGISFGMALLGMCSEIWVFGDYISNGMAREICRARYLKIPIRYFTADFEEIK